MTICVGALASGGRSIVCVADKGLSYGPGIQWDSDSTKIIPIGATGVHALIAGQELMISRVLRGMLALPDLGEDVTATINACEGIYQNAEVEVLEAAFLRPQMLSITDYNTARIGGNINPFIERLTEQMRNERNDPQYTACEMLLCGFDQSKSPFILKLGSPGLVENSTHTGHAAVGSGYERAIARLLWDGWERKHPIERVLFDTFDAKADAEMVPTVGADWDAVIITAEGSTSIPEKIKGLVERAWVKVTRSPWEKHNPVTDIPEAPETWKQQLARYCKGILVVKAEDQPSPQSTTADPSPPQPSPDSSATSDES